MGGPINYPNPQEMFVATSQEKRIASFSKSSSLTFGRNFALDFQDVEEGQQALLKHLSAKA